MLEAIRGESVCGILHRYFFASGNAPNRPNLLFTVKDVNRPGSAACRVTRLLIKEISDFLIIYCVISFGLLKDRFCVHYVTVGWGTKRYDERLRR